VAAQDRTPAKAVGPSFAETPEQDLVLLNGLLFGEPASQTASCARRRARLLSLAAVSGRAPKKIRCFDPEDPREPVDHVDCRRVQTSFERADIRTVEFCAMREFFLRQAFCPSKLPQVERHDLSNIHG
jgi:hypothetical protein